MAEAARAHDLTVREIEEWREKFLLGAENALRSRPKEDEGLREGELRRLKAKIGELALDNDILREAAKLRPLRWGGRPTSEGDPPRGI